MPDIDLENAQRENVARVIRFFGDIVMPMIDAKETKKSFGEITFYLEEERPVMKDGHLYGFDKTTKLDFSIYKKYWEKFMDAKDINEKIKLWYDYNKDTGYSNNPFTGCLHIYFSYENTLARKGMCRLFYGAHPYAHIQEKTFPKLKNGKEFCYGCVTPDMLEYENDTECPFGKYILMLTAMKGKKLTINRKEYKNIIVAQKRVANVRKIAERPDVNFLRNANYIYGNVTVFSDKGASLYGDAKNIYGNINSIYGEINKKLTGDVSNLVGDITNLVGNVTGIHLRLARKLKKETNIQDLLFPDFMKKFNLLSNEDNQKLMKVWSCFSHHTIGVTDEERKLFDHPIKCTPPFKVDRWGRKYIPDKNPEYMWVFSINPADIMFAKDVNKCSSCFCLNSGNERWDYGMRCLIALNSVNPNLGVAFKIKKNSVKKMNQFAGVKFKWYEPEDASFFQYTSDGVYIWNACRFDTQALPFDVLSYGELHDKVKKIYGHDGINCGHERQETLAYLETFIKDGYRWYNGCEDDFPLCNNYTNYCADEISDEWKKQIELANEKAIELKELLKGE